LGNGDKMKCGFCGGNLGAIQTQKHDNPMFAEYRVCLKCNYQWAKEYWEWLERQEKGES
jgi:DNA-directed RNA polymerase subunit M/transcription elongation factor TFIIS